MQTQIQNKNYCAIYCRLSQEDDRTGTSGSILNQKETLRDYVLDNGWNIYDVYVDDGVSGTTFERPGFKAMIKDIEKGKINTVITKDLSRLGRDYLKAGYYTEQFFPENNIRFIAVNDNVDTHKENSTELTPFKNIMNEWYAKDISKKVRFSIDNQIKSLVQTKTSIAIYGYTFNELNQRVIDPNTAPIVQYIFRRYLECKCAKTISKELQNKKVPVPGYYAYMQTNYHQDLYSTFTETQKYEWESNKIYRILNKEEYLGTYIRGKTKTKFKTKKNVKNEKIHKKENAFEPLITKVVFQQVNNIKSSHGVKNTDNIFQGLIFCNECKNKLRTSSYKGKISRLYCRNPISDTDASIKYEDLKHIVKTDIENIKKLILSNETEFIDYAIYYKSNNFNATNHLNDIEIYKTKKSDIEKKVSLLLESFLKEDIDKSLYESLLSKYNKEQKEYDTKIKELENKITNNNVTPVDYIVEAKLLLEVLKSYSELDEFFLKSFINKIYIHKDPKDISVRKTYVEIEYNRCNELIKEYLNDSSIIS